MSEYRHKKFSVKAKQYMKLETPCSSSDASFSSDSNSPATINEGWKYEEGAAIEKKADQPTEAAIDMSSSNNSIIPESIKTLNAVPTSYPSKYPIPYYNNAVMPRLPVSLSLPIRNQNSGSNNTAFHHSRMAATENQYSYHTLSPSSNRKRKHNDIAASTGNTDSSKRLYSGPTTNTSPLTTQMEFWNILNLNRQTSHRLSSTSTLAASPSSPLSYSPSSSSTPKPLSESTLSYSSTPSSLSKFSSSPSSSSTPSSSSISYAGRKRVMSSSQTPYAKRDKILQKAITPILGGRTHTSSSRRTPITLDTNITEPSTIIQSSLATSTLASLGLSPLSTLINQSLLVQSLPQPSSLPPNIVDLVSKEKLINVYKYHANMVRKFPKKQRSPKDQDRRNKNTIACRISRYTKKLGHLTMEEEYSRSIREYKQFAQFLLLVEVSRPRLTEDMQQLQSKSFSIDYLLGSK